MRVNLKCVISRKRLIVERNGEKIGTQSPTVHICRVLLMADSLSLILGKSVPFANFPILQFSKHYSLPNFHPISAKLYTRYHNHGTVQAITFLDDLPPQNYGILKVFLTQDNNGAGNAKVLFLP